MIEARDHNGCTVMALDHIVFHETWCDYVREFVLVFCERNSINNNNKNNNNNNNRYLQLQISSFTSSFWFLRPWCLLLEQATSQVYRSCWISKPIQRWKTTRRLGTDSGYPTKGERKLIFPTTLGWDIGIIWYSSQDGKSIVVMNHGEPRYDRWVSFTILMEKWLLWTHQLHSFVWFVSEVGKRFEFTTWPGQ